MTSCLDFAGEVRAAGGAFDSSFHLVAVVGGDTSNQFRAALAATVEPLIFALAAWAMVVAVRALAVRLGRVGGRRPATSSPFVRPRP